MASLMEDLIEVLNQECIAYDELLGLSSKKTPVIAAGVLEKLSQITDEEQIAVGKIQTLEKRRIEAFCRENGLIVFPAEDAIRVISGSDCSTA